MTASRDWNSPEYKKWRLAVYKRDKFKCRFPNCKSKSKRLNAHHIKRWADNPELRFAIFNGICLCHTHHKLVTGNEEQYEAMFQSIIDVKNDDCLQALVNSINKRGET